MKDSLTATRRFLEDAFFERLIRDLDKGNRNRRIKREEYEVAKAVARLPERPTDQPDLSKEIQMQAKDQATYILECVASGYLRYDSNAHAHFVRG